MLKRSLLTIACLACCCALADEKDDMRKKIEEFRNKELTYQRIAYKRLGEEIAKRHPGAKILLIKYKDVANENGKPSPIDAVQMVGLKKGLNGKAKIEVVESVSSGMEELLEEDGKPQKSHEEIIKEMYTAEKFNKLVAANKNCNVVVSLAGLPSDYQLLKLWKVKDPKKRPALVLANAYLYELMGPIKFKFITAALAHKAVPFDINKPVPNDEQKAFDLRYLMITPDNVLKIHRENPDFFKSMRKK